MGSRREFEMEFVTEMRNEKEKKDFSFYDLGICDIFK
jgi:hypothetical protein